MMLGIVVPVAVLLAAASTSWLPQSPAGAGIERVSWLRGCWEMNTSVGTIEEHWLSPRGGTMLGMSRTVQNGRTVDYELVVLREEGSGLAYDAHPSNQPPAVFLSRGIDDSSVVFENLQHDFPQRVGYRRDGADALVAWIEGPSGGDTRRIEFPYHRAACPSSEAR